MCWALMSEGGRGSAAVFEGYDLLLCYRCCLRVVHKRFRVLLQKGKFSEGSLVLLLYWKVMNDCFMLHCILSGGGINVNCSPVEVDVSCSRLHGGGKDEYSYIVWRSQPLTGDSLFCVIRR